MITSWRLPDVCEFLQIRNLYGDPVGWWHLFIYLLPVILFSHTLIEYFVMFVSQDLFDWVHPRTLVRNHHNELNMIKIIIAVRSILNCTIATNCYQLLPIPFVCTKYRSPLQSPFLISAGIWWTPIISTTKRLKLLYVKFQFDYVINHVINVVLARAIWALALSTTYTQSSFIEFPQQQPTHLLIAPIWSNRRT